MQEHPSQRTEGHSHLCVHRPARCTEPVALGTLGCWGHAPAALDLTHRDSAHTRESCPSTAPPAHTPAFVLLAGDTEVRRIPGSLCPEQTTSVWMQNPHKIHSHLMSFSKYICLHFACHKVIPGHFSVLCLLCPQHQDTGIAPQANSIGGSTPLAMPQSHRAHRAPLEPNSKQGCHKTQVMAS